MKGKQIMTPFACLILQKHKKHEGRDTYEDFCLPEVVTTPPSLCFHLHANLHGLWSDFWCQNKLVSFWEKMGWWRTESKGCGKDEKHKFTGSSRKGLKSCTAQAPVAFLHMPCFVKHWPKTPGGLMGGGFKKAELYKTKVWCRESTFCYFYPLGITSQRWMGAQRLLGKKAGDVLAVPASERSRSELLRALLFRPSPMA